jgi:hypothetical protein
MSTDEERTQAIEQVEKQFGEEATAWIERFTEPPSPSAPDTATRVAPPKTQPGRRSILKSLPPLDSTPKLPRFDPNDPESASEGRML